MERPLCMSALLVLLASRGAGAQEQDVTGLRFKVIDLVFRVESFGGQVVDLQVKENRTEVRIELAADVLFDFDKAELKPEAVASLSKVAEVLNGIPNAPTTVDGHTDGRGSADYNQKLSERRAGSVKEWLVKQGGVPAARLTARGFGMTRPVAPNTKPDGADDPQGRQKNRRVEIRVKKT